MPETAGPTSSADRASNSPLLGSGVARMMGFILPNGEGNRKWSNDAGENYEFMWSLRDGSTVICNVVFILLFLSCPAAPCQSAERAIHAREMIHRGRKIQVRARHQRGAGRAGHPSRHDLAPGGGGDPAGRGRRARLPAAEFPFCHRRDALGGAGRDARTGRSHRTGCRARVAGRNRLHGAEMAIARFSLRLAGRSRRETALVRGGRSDARPAPARGRRAAGAPDRSLARALRMALDGTIKDAKTITSILLWDRLRNAE